MNQTNHFFDLGYGWLCKHCSAADSEARQHPHESRKGFFNHHDSHEKENKPAGLPFATWVDSSRSGLVCPRCGVHETIKY